MSSVEQEVAQPAGSHAIPIRNESLLESIRRTVQSGKMSYYIFVSATVPALGWWYSLAPFPQVTNAITQWCPYPNLVIGALYAGVGLLVWGWSKRVDNRMESVAQNHWQRHREALRSIFTNSYKSDHGNVLKKVY